MKIYCRYCNRPLPKNRELDLCGKCSYPRTTAKKETKLNQLTDAQRITFQPGFSTPTGKPVSRK